MKLLLPAFKIAVLSLLIWSVSMLITAAIGSQNWHQSWPFISSASICVTLSAFLYFISKPKITQLQPRALFLATTLNWLLLTITGMLPYLFSDHNPGVVNAFFETISGLTTTGSSIFNDVESLPPNLLLWRSMTQWFGGIGIILVAVAVLPSLRGGGMRLFRSEFSEWSQLEVGKVSRLATMIMVAYLLISALCYLSFWLGGMTWFVAFNHMMATVSTGGFSTWNDSFSHFHSDSLQLIATIFMILGASPFLSLVLSLEKKHFNFLHDRQVQHLLLMCLGSAILIAFWRYYSNNETARSWISLLESSFFNVVSIATTTGFASEDYSQWGGFAVMILCFLMFSGGASGSTSGGVKLFRYHLLFIFMHANMISALHPQARHAKQYNGRSVQEDILLGSLAFFCSVIVALCVCASLLSLSGLDPITSLTGSLSALMNVGPGFGDIIGPVGNYSSLNDTAKITLGFAMLLGRLEYLTVIIIFTPAFWRW
jgi:trk system potassium uptake protein TrkH